MFGKRRSNGSVVEIRIVIDTDTNSQLAELGNSDALGWMGGENRGHTTASVADVVRYLACSVADGVRRPGSWERGCVEQLFGSWQAETQRRAVVQFPSRGRRPS